MFTLRIIIKVGLKCYNYNRFNNSINKESIINISKMKYTLNIAHKYNEIKKNNVFNAKSLLYRNKEL